MRNAPSSVCCGRWPVAADPKLLIFERVAVALVCLLLTAGVFAQLVTIWAEMMREDRRQRENR